MSEREKGREGMDVSNGRFVNTDEHLLISIDHQYSIVPRT